MSIINDIKNFFTPQQFMIGDELISVLVREEVTHGWDFTKRPTEAGLPISDHRRARPTDIKIDAAFTDDSPMLTVAAITALTDGIQSAKDKGEKLLSVLKANSTVTLSLLSGVYEDYACEVHSRSIDASNSSAWVCSMTFSEIRSVATQLTTVSLTAQESKALDLPSPTLLKDQAEKKTNKVPKGKDKKEKPKGLGANETASAINSFTSGVAGV
jgi:hypothetical protein